MRSHPCRGKIEAASPAPTTCLINLRRLTKADSEVISFSGSCQSGDMRISDIYIECCVLLHGFSASVATQV